MSENSLYVGSTYKMDPEFDDLLFDGTMLKPGMIVLIADDDRRASIPFLSETMDAYQQSKRDENCRWCVVERVNIRKRFDYDEYGNVIGEGSPLVEFLASYPDGTKKKRIYDASYAWYVKIASIPKD